MTKEKTLNHFQNLLTDQVIVNDFSETSRWMEVASKEHPSPISLNFGENWQRCSPELIAELNNTSAWEHGYQLSFYGDPEFRQFLKSMIIRSESWTASPSMFIESELPFEIAVSWNGTRSAMYDFGRYLQEKDAETGRRNNKIQFGFCPSPGWTYRGVFQAVGLQTQTFQLKLENSFAVTRENLNAAVDAIKKKGGEIRWVVINAQQNPTGNNWSAAEVNMLIDLALEHNAALLIDNAYFGMTQEPSDSTSAIQIILSRWNEIKKSSIAGEIVYVRSLGKAFHCNGWALGAMAAAPDVLQKIAVHFRRRRGIPSHGFLQRAMLRWLEAGKGEEFSKVLRREHNLKLQWVNKTLTDKFGYTSDGFYLGTHTPYLILQIPPSWQKEENAVETYLDAVAKKTGVLFGRCFEAEPNFPWVRVYLGAHTEIVETAFNRLLEAGFVWDT